MRGNEGADGKDCAATDREHLTAGPGPLVILAIGFRFFFGAFFSTISLVEHVQQGLFAPMQRGVPARFFIGT